MHLFSTVLNRVQVIEKARGIFIELDANLDGYLTGDELRKMVDWALSFFKPDGALLLTVEEKQEYRRFLLSVIDRDRNGNVNLEEFASLFEQLAREKARNRRLQGELLPLPSHSDLNPGQRRNLKDDQ